MRLSLNNSARAAAAADAAGERLRSYLRARGLRMTAERQALVEAALSRERHFTLEELVDDAVSRSAAASRATVYRALPILVEAGIVQPVLVTGEPRRFELAVGRRHHDHLRCRGCGRVVEFHSQEIEDLQTRIAARHGFRLTSHLHELVGECAACRRAQGPEAGERR
jgi:Fur family ferric uptake transcriptional regulator